MSTEPIIPTSDAQAALLGAQDDVEPRTTPPENPEGDPAKTGEELDENGEPKKKMGGFQKRIQKLSSRLAAQEEEIARLRAGVTAPKAEPQTISKPEPPNEDPFASYSEFKAAERKYFEDLADWKAEEKLNAREQSRKAETEAAKQKEQADQARTTWNERLAAAHEAHPDLEDLLEEQDLPTTPAMAQALMDSDLGGELLHHLATHPEECRRIAGLSPVGSVRALGQIEAQLIAAKKTADVAPKKATSAPAPLAPLKGSGAATRDLASIKNDDEWYRTRRAQQGR